MCGFVYYLPNRDRSVKAADLRSMGLSYAFEDQASPRGVAHGPDDSSGVVVGNEATIQAGLVKYDKDRQKWRQLQLPELDQSVWVGMYTDENRPTPQDLQRLDVVDGKWLTLDDENKWLIPHARVYRIQDGDISVSCNLPRRLSLDDDGLWIAGEVKPKYERLWRLLNEYDSNLIITGTTVKIDQTFLCGLVICALQTNYRVGPIECDLLGILSQDTSWSVIDVLEDSATYFEWKKKRDDQGSGGLNSSAGLEPLTQDVKADTAPPLRT